MQKRKLSDFKFVPKNKYCRNSRFYAPTAKLYLKKKKKAWEHFFFRFQNIHHKFTLILLSFFAAKIQS